MTEQTTAPVRVLLVDDDPLVCTGLRLMFRGAGDVQVIGEVDDGAGVADAVQRLAPDVVLMDVRMPYIDGIAATRGLTTRPLTRARDRVPAVIILTTFDADATVLDAMRAGAAGFLLKHTPPEEIVEAIRRAAAGEPVLSPSAARTLIRHAAETGEPGNDQRTDRARTQLALLTDREREVALAVAEGLSNAEIAARLHMSVGTVKAHISSALSKLDLNNRIQLALLAHDGAEHPA